MAKKSISINKKKTKNVPDNRLIMKRLRDTASTASQQNNGISFGLPRQPQIIWPGQSIRLATGWSVSQYPQQTRLLTTTPHKQLIGYNLISIPEFYDKSTGGTQICQVVLNNNDQPIKIQVLNLQDEPKLVKIDPQTLQTTQELNLKFNFGNFINGVLSAGTQIATLFA